MKPTKYFATIHGHTFTRSSQRVYTHMVVGFIDIAADRASTAAWARKGYAINLEYTTKMAAGGTYVGTFNDGSTYTSEITDMRRDAARATLAGGVDAAVSDRLREFDARDSEQLKSPDGLSYVYDAGWCGRHDLAVKLAAKTPGGVILAAQVKS